MRPSRRGRRRGSQSFEDSIDPTAGHKNGTARAGLAAGALIALLAVPVEAKADDAADIRAALTRWAADFNAGRADRVCDLFAKDLVADVQGVGERDYAEQCATLQGAVRDKSKTFTYAPLIGEIIVAGDVALVRLDWKLTVEIAGNSDSATSVEAGMDFFRRQPDGSWKISRFMTYGAS